MDAAVFTSIFTKRLVLLAVVIVNIMASLDKSARASAFADLDQSICYMVIYGCSNPYSIISSLLTTVAIFTIRKNVIS
jgi:hypothetical protein